MDFLLKSGPLLHTWPFTSYCFTKVLSKVSQADLPPTHTQKNDFCGYMVKLSDVVNRIHTS